MRDRIPTVRSRTLGEGLHQVMKDAGLNMSQVARQLDWSPSRVSRLLSGKRGGSGYDVSAFLAACGAKTAAKDRLMELVEDQYRKSWFQQHGVRLPKQVRALINHEKEATAIRQFEYTLMPGLLQTGVYFRALLTESGRVPEEEIGGRVASRLGRKNIFSKPNPPEFTFFIHEFALRLPVGGASVMAEQLHELLQMSVRPNINIRVVPTSLGGHAGTAGSFTLMEFKEIKPIVYLDSETSSLFLEMPLEIAAYESILDALEKTALPEGQSKAFLEKLAKRYAGGGVRDDLEEEQL
jgi:transcriptional regulator with XRE-family HTH domain